MREKRFTPLSLMLAVLVTFAATLAGLFLAAWMIIGPQGLTLLQGLTLIQTRFVGEYDQDKVLDSAMAGMVSGLDDRWSYYLSPSRYQTVQNQRKNEYVGIGITVSFQQEEGVLIESVASGGPAEQAGIIPGDIIIAVDGTSVAGEARTQATELIQGDKGTTVTLELLALDGSKRSVPVVRGTVEEQPVSFELLDGAVGYIQVKNFYLRSADGVKEAVEKLQEQGAWALVFDMRNNGGGYLDELTDMLDFLLPEGPIFRARDRAGHEQVTESDADFVDLPMAVLVNENTYSAAEFFAGELQERGVAVVVGTPTSGKGYSQQTYPLFGGGAMGVSTAAYFTGRGVSFVGTGLPLDREVALNDEDALRLSKGVLPREEDPQLQEALRLIHAPYL